MLGRKLTMRQETIKALETRRNSVMAERKKSHMQTLGAAHEYGVSTASGVGASLGVVPGLSAALGGSMLHSRNHRNSVASMSVKDLFEAGGGQVNRAFEPGPGYEAGGVISEDEMEPGGNALRLHAVRNNVSWREENGHPRSNSRM